jgi:hypothetical protein
MENLTNDVKVFTGAPHDDLRQANPYHTHTPNILFGGI